MIEYWRYPFLPSANFYLEGLTLESLLEDYFYSEARALAIARLETSATTGIIDVEAPPINDEADIVLSYVISRLILAAADNQALVNYVALSEARRAEKYLLLETDESLVNVVNSLKIITVSLDGGNFSMNFLDYVKAASKLREGNWKLANKGVQNGVVTLDRETLVRLMREVIRQHLEELPEAPVEIRSKFKMKIIDKKVLLIGVSYREDTNDTRYSPAETVFDFFKKLRCKLNFYDPVVGYWDYINNYSVNKKNLNNYDIYVHLVKHQLFNNINIPYKKNSIIFDLNHTLNIKKREKILKSKYYESYFIGSKNK